MKDNTLERLFDVAPKIMVKRAENNFLEKEI